MSLYAQLKEKRQERKNVLDVAGNLLTKAAKEKRSLTAEENTEFENRHADGDRLLKEIGQLEKQHEAETSLGEIPADKRSAGREDIAAAGEQDDEPGVTPEQRKAAEKRALRKWMQGGMAALDATELRTLERRNASLDQEARALSAASGNGTSGTYTVPTGQPYALDIALKSYGGLLSVVDYIDTDSGVTLPYPTINDTANSGEQLAESTAATQTQDPTFGLVNLGAYMTDSGIVLVPIQLLQDSAFDPEVWMNDTLRTRLGRRMNAKGTTGTGTNEQTGVVTASTLGVTAAAVAAVTYNELLDLEHTVDPAYRNPGQARWMYNDSTLKALKKLVDSNGRPLWIAGGVSEGVQNRRPDTLDGYEYAINQDMASLATGNKTILFGDFSKFKIRRVKQIQFIRFGERFMEKLQIGFMAYIRWDSNLIDAGTNPVKHLKQA
jgi:HK97 family phage major capsid protein